MLVVGLTGSIGMGKSTLAAHLRERGIAVFDADAEVHRLYSGPLAAAVGSAFEGTVAGGVVDRRKLSEALARDPSGFKLLEGVVHPLVQLAEQQFLAAERDKGAELAVLEIPLLFETSAETKFDAVILASAPDDIRRARVLPRAGMTAEKLDLIVARQGAEAEKRAKADFVVDTGGSHADSLASLDAIIDRLKGRAGTAFVQHWA